MPLSQSIDGALEKNVGRHGVKEAALDAMLARTQGALDWLRRHHAEGTLPLLRLPESQDDLAEIRGAAQKLTAGATDIVMLGTGGSSLGGQTLVQLADYKVPGAGDLRGPPRMHFIDNLDPHTYADLLARLPLATTRFVSISKSGGTAETLMQTIAALSALKQAGLDPRNAVLGISEPARAGKRNGLRESARQASGAAARPRPGRGRTLFGAHQCRPAAGRHARARYRRHSPRRRRRAARRCSTASRRRKLRPRSVPRLAWRWRTARTSAC